MEDLRLAVADLHSSTEHSFALISQIVARGDRLAGSIAATRMNFSVGTLFAEAVSRARSSIKEMVERAQSGLPRDNSEKLDLELADFVSHYTMQAERDVHEGVTRAVTGAAPVSAPADWQNSTPGEADQLGDNVEFF
jgi:hypothetical protein